MVARNEAMNSNLLVAALASFLVTLYLAAVITSNAYWHWLKAKNPSPYDVKKPASVESAARVLGLVPQRLQQRRRGRR